MDKISGLIIPGEGAGALFHFLEGLEIENINGVKHGIAPIIIIVENI